MTTAIKKSPVRHGLRDISMDEFWKDPLIVVDALQLKLQSLPINPKTNLRFAQQMSTSVELLRAIGTRRYGKISFLAALDLLQAAHYFLLLGDRRPDSQADGYRDDAEILQQVFTKHESEMGNFQRWLQTQG